jgi:hypothetical protein
MTATVRRLAPRVLPAPALCALLVLCLSVPPAAAARGAQRAASPLSASEYSVRPVCAPPTARRASCAALELVPRTPAAQAHTGSPTARRTARANAVAGEESCTSRIPADGCLGLRPEDLHSAYGIPLNAPSPQTIALVDAFDDPTAEHDLKVYDEEFELPPCTQGNGCFKKINAEGDRKPLPAENGAAAAEISLDVEVAHATCESCQLLLVEADSLEYKDLEAAENRAVSEGATEISNSWFGNEPVSDSEAFNHPGTVITAASGDEGFLNWDAEEEAARGMVNYPASSPHVVAVGGTRLTRERSTGAWVDESVWNGEGATGSGCSQRFPAAPWQQELPDWTSIGCGSRRAVADVAADADPFTGAIIYDSTPLREGGTPPFWRAIGGTSLATPLIAGMFALAGGANGVEYPAKTLYENDAQVHASLHDIESGSNGECNEPLSSEGLAPCSPIAEAASCAGEGICLAASGYDGPSGVGTPDGLRAFEPSAGAGKKAQLIEFTSTAPDTASVGGANYTVTASAGSGLAVSFTSGTPSVCSLAGSTVSFIASGPCTIDADQGGDSEFEEAAQARQSFAVGRGDQVITFTSSAPASAAVGGAPYAVAASASSGLNVALSSTTPSVCALAGSSVSFLAAGTCTLEAEQEGDSSYRKAPAAQQSFAVGPAPKLTQQISFSSSAPAAAIVAGPPYTVTASASSGLAVSLSSQTPTICNLAGATVSFDAAGTCTIDAEQPGDGEYEAAPAAQQSFAVAPEAALLPGPLLASAGALSFTASTPPAPDSAFSVTSRLVNAKTGAITLTVSFADPGTFSSLLTFPAGSFGVAQASRAKCKPHQIELDGRCRAALIVFGRLTKTVPAAGIARFTIKPSAAASEALVNAKRKGRGLTLAATLTFRSSLGGSPVSHVRSFSDRLAQR